MTINWESVSRNKFFFFRTWFGLDVERYPLSFTDSLPPTSYPLYPQLIVEWSLINKRERELKKQIVWVTKLRKILYCKHGINYIR